MTEQRENDMSKQAWQSQTIEAPTISLAFIHHHVAKLNAQFRHESLLVNWTVALGIVAALVALVIPAPNMSSARTYVTFLAVALAIAGFIYVAVQVRRRGGQVAIRKEESIADSLNAYRAELQRRRDYYRGSWRWSIGPLLPAVVVFLIAGFWFNPRPESRSHLAFVTVFAVIFILLGALDHRRKAKAFQEELDALDTLYRR